MDVVIREHAECTHVEVDGELTIYSAAESKTHFLKALSLGAKIEVDLAAVTEIDTAGLQLMLMLKRESQQRGKTLAFTHHSAVVREMIELLNLVGVLGDPLLIPGQR